jgi:hypothetical protein
MTTRPERYHLLEELVDGFVLAGTAIIIALAVDCLRFLHRR